MTEDLLQLRAVRKVFPGGPVGLEGIDLTVRQGEFLSLLGPSGCGKTTTLRVIAGFESPTSGTVVLDGKDITPHRPYDRPVNTVFQDYALFPHMDVHDNIDFGLSLRRLPLPDRAARIRKALELVGLPEKARARVGALSGGQRQRVALARAMVCEPRVLLLDEPLSALDAHLREQMQLELKRLQSELGTTFVMVTHDQTEAMSISDRIVVMNRGRIEQTASPAALYDYPETRFVAGFIGTMNLVPAVVTDLSGTETTVDFCGLPLVVQGDTARQAARGDTAMAAVRPEDLQLVDAAPAIRGTVTAVVFHGKSLRLRVAVAGGHSLSVDVPRQASSMTMAPGVGIRLGLRAGAQVRLL